MVEKLRKIGTAGRKLWKSVSTSTRNSFNCYVEYWFRRSKQISVVKKVCLNVKEKDLDYMDEGDKSLKSNGQSKPLSSHIKNEKTENKT